MNKQNQNGSVHVVLVGIVAVVIIGTVGFLFWNNFLKPKAVEKSVAKVELTQKASPSTEAKPETMALSEWGVKFTSTDALKTAGIEVKKVTTPNTDGSGGIFTYYYISTSRQRALQATEENMNKLCDAGSAVSVSRSTESGTSTEAAPLQINTKPIGGFYYTWSIPSMGGCDGPDTKAIVNALKSLEAI